MADFVHPIHGDFRTRHQLLPWEKAYWYLRLLVNSDRYGALAKDKRRIDLIQQNLLGGYWKAKLQNETEKDSVKILRSLMEQTLLDGLKKESTKYVLYVDLLDELDAYLVAPIDFFILGISIKEVLIPTNKAIADVPTKEATEFAKKYAVALMDTKKEAALSNIVREWDVLTEDLSLNKERDLMTTLFGEVRSKVLTRMSEYKEKLSERDLDVILTAVCQEFERRTGQKRKQRAGKDLESGIDFILNYFGLETAGGPEHFSSGLEVDNWLKDKNGWYVGISLKRTLRERWKQTYTTEIGLYDRFKIKNIIHVLNNDRDLSDSKIAEMGSYRHLFFLADKSTVLSEYQNHPAVGKYIFPMTSLIFKLRELLGK